MGPELFEAVRSLLAPAVPESVSVHDTDASHVSGDGANYPFIVLSGGVPRQYSDSAGWCRDEATALVRVTHTGLSAVSVRALLASTRGALEDAEPVIEGWHGFGLTIDDSRGVDVDRDVEILTGTTASFPFYAVDVYKVQVTR